MRFALRFLGVAALAMPLAAGQWSATADATDGRGNALVTCRSRIAGDHLVVELRAKDGWHVYAMDNERRAKQALAGKMSLGVEQDTEIAVTAGLSVVGPWYQTEPRDFSQPSLRWYSYGFEGTAVMAAKVKLLARDTASVSIRAQACDSASCIAVDASLSVPLGVADGETFSTKGMVEVLDE